MLAGGGGEPGEVWPSQVETQEEQEWLAGVKLTVDARGLTQDGPTRMDSTASWADLSDQQGCVLQRRLRCPPLSLMRTPSTNYIDFGAIDRLLTGTFFMDSSVTIQRLPH